MAIIYLLSWWYGPGWLHSFSQIRHRLVFVIQELSILVLLRTLFEPWKQITSYKSGNASLEEKFRVWFDNIFARVIGFIVRMLTITFGLVALVIVFIVSLILALVWPLVPFLPILLIYLGIS